MIRSIFRSIFSKIRFFFSFFFSCRFVFISLYWYYVFFFIEIMREIITFKFDRENINKIIVDSIKINMRQMQKMRLNWKQFDEIIFFKLSIEHWFRKFSQFHEIQLLNYLKCHFHAYLNEMIWFMWNEFKIAVNDSTINRVLKRLNWNKKKSSNRQFNDVKHFETIEWFVLMIESRNNWCFLMKMQHVSEQINVEIDFVFIFIDFFKKSQIWLNFDRNFYFQNSVFSSFEKMKHFICFHRWKLHRLKNASR